MKLNLKRPIIFFDLETTGVDTARDRIVEISMIKIMPDGEEIYIKRMPISSSMISCIKRIRHIVYNLITK